MECFEWMHYQLALFNIRHNVWKLCTTYSSRAPVLASGEMRVLPSSLLFFICFKFVLFWESRRISGQAEPWGMSGRMDWYLWPWPPERDGNGCCYTGTLPPPCKARYTTGEVNSVRRLPSAEVAVGNNRCFRIKREKTSFLEHETLMRREWDAAMQQAAPVNTWKPNTIAWRKLSYLFLWKHVFDTQLVINLL